MSAIDVLLKNIRQTNELLEQRACNKASMATDQLQNLDSEFAINFFPIFCMFDFFIAKCWGKIMMYTFFYCEKRLISSYFSSYFFLVGSKTVQSPFVQSTIKWNDLLLKCLDFFFLKKHWGMLMQLQTGETSILLRRHYPLHTLNNRSGPC